MSTELEFSPIREGADSVVEGIRLAVSESLHLKLTDAPTLRSALFIAEEIDRTLPGDVYEVARNLGPTLLKYLEALGFTPSGRKALGLVDDAEEGEGDELDALTDAVPGLRIVP